MKEGDEPVNAVIIRIHAGPPHHTMKEVDGPIVPTGGHIAYLLQLVSSQPPILLAGLLKDTLIGG